MPFRRANCHAKFEINDAGTGSSAGISSDENADPNIPLSSSSCLEPTKSGNASILLCGQSESDNNDASIPIPTSSSLPPISSSPLPSELPLPPTSQSLSLSYSPTAPSLSSLIATLCRGVYSGYFGRALLFAGMTMQNTARQLMKWASESDVGIASFRASGLSQSRGFCLPYYGMIMDRAPDPTDGYVFHAESCHGSCIVGCSNSNQCCDVCKSKKGMNLAKEIRKLPLALSKKHAGERSSIHNIANNPNLANIEIPALPDEVKQLKREATIRAVLDAEMAKHGLEVPNASSSK